MTVLDESPYVPVSPHPYLAARLPLSVSCLLKASLSGLLCGALEELDSTYRKQLLLLKMTRIQSA